MRSFFEVGLTSEDLCEFFYKKVKEREKINEWMNEWAMQREREKMNEWTNERCRERKGERETFIMWSIFGSGLAIAYSNYCIALVFSGLPGRPQRLKVFINPHSKKGKAPTIYETLVAPLFRKAGIETDVISECSDILIPIYKINAAVICTRLIDFRLVLYIFINPERMREEIEDQWQMQMTKVVWAFKAELYLFKINFNSDIQYNCLMSNVA